MQISQKCRLYTFSKSKTVFFFAKFHFVFAHSIKTSIKKKLINCERLARKNINCHKLFATDRVTELSKANITYIKGICLIGSGNSRVIRGVCYGRRQSRSSPAIYALKTSFADSMLIGWIESNSSRCWFQIWCAKLMQQQQLTINNSINYCIEV